jgi:hypothetical protein
MDTKFSFFFYLLPRLFLILSWDGALEWAIWALMV